MSIHVFAKIKVKEGTEAAVQETIRELAAASSAEAGCVAYQAFLSNNDATVIRIKEEWQSLDALQEHMTQPHFQQFGARHAKDFAEPLEVDVVQRL